MRMFTVYDKTTGDIKKTLLVPTTHNVQLSDGEALLEGQYDDDKFFVENGEPCAKSIPDEDQSLSADDSDSLPMDEDYIPTLDDIRLARNQMLLASDWTQLPDAPADKAAWALYRQQLRELPDNTDDPLNVVWPTQP